MNKIDKLLVWIYKRLYSTIGFKNIYTKEIVESQVYVAGTRNYITENRVGFTLRRVSNKLGAWLDYKIRIIEDQDLLKEFEPVFDILKSGGNFNDTVTRLLGYGVKSSAAYRVVGYKDAIIYE